MALVLGLDFAWGEKPQFKNSETLKIDYGNFSYMAQKQNQMRWLALEHAYWYECTNKNQ